MTLFDHVEAPGRAALKAGTAVALPCTARTDRSKSRAVKSLVFAQFLSEKLDGERGRQTQLANDLQISKSTITAWRNGAKPDFISCLMLSEHFGLDPVRMLKMVGDATYLAIYRRFLAQGRGRPRRLDESDLYPECRHAQVHHELQMLLESETEAAAAIVTMIRSARSQLPDARDSDAVNAPAIPDSQALPRD